MPNASQIFRHRSANLPDSSTIALPPRGTRLTTAASIAPVPELVSSSTSFSVAKTYFSPAKTSASRPRNSGVRWCVTCRAMLSRAASGTSVGPGVIRRCLGMDRKR